MFFLFFFSYTEKGNNSISFPPPQVNKKVWVIPLIIWKYWTKKKPACRNFEFLCQRNYWLQAIWSPTCVTRVDYRFSTRPQCFPDFFLLCMQLLHWNFVHGFIQMYLGLADQVRRWLFSTNFYTHVFRWGVLCYGVVRPAEFVQAITPDPLSRFEQYFTWLLPWT
jgi:hypothetical protein